MAGDWMRDGLPEAPGCRRAVRMLRTVGRSPRNDHG
jgi:hypothetical protein